ncbi:LPS export ABC transporter permease LptG [Curvivirga sp.]|uniref:LPS export ABC transporter permease LptG n=1 Tax=Curvivirga sp. TaxID=2856848 RepID=UPI003B5A13BF
MFRTLTGTMPRYISRQFLFWIIFVFFALSFLFALFDFVELMRRASGKADASFSIILQMSLTKLPHLLQDIFPFVMLFGSIVAFWRLSKTSELVIARAAGFSAWQILRLPIVLAFGIGVLQITSFGPFAAQMYNQFEQLENEYLKRGGERLSLSGTGLWLRQGNKNHQEVIHAQIALEGGKRLQHVTVYQFEGDNNYVGRIDAQVAILFDGHWTLRNATIFKPNTPLQLKSIYRIPTTLTSKKIEDSYNSEDTLSFWVLPDFIKTLEDSGFDASNHKMRLHSLLSTPFLLVAMVLIAATFAMRTSNRRGAAFTILSGIGCGFVLYFFTNVVQALGLSTTIPVWIAAWIPAIVSLMLGITALLHTEDG